MDLFKGICLFLKIFIVTLLRITKNEGRRALCLLHNSKLLKQAIPFVAYIINY